MQLTPLALKKILTHAIKAVQAGENELAIKLSAAILAEDADHAAACAIQFRALYQSAQLEKARHLGQKAAALNPHSEFILDKQACLQIDAGEGAQAVELINTLISQLGERAAWLYNRGLAQRVTGDLEKSIASFRRTLDLNPSHHRAVFQLVDCLQAVGRLNEALLERNLLRILRSRYEPAHSRYIHHAVNLAQISKQELKQEADLWGKLYTPSSTRYAIEALADPKNIKIAFLIGKIPNHWLEKMVAPLINQLAEGDENIIVYAHNQDDLDLLTHAKIKKRAVANLSDAEFAIKVRRDRVDIFVDVAGLREGQRQRALGMQIASRQFGWLVHEGIFTSRRVRVLDVELGQSPFYIDLSSKNTASRKTKLPKTTLLAIGCKSGLASPVVQTWSELMLKLNKFTLHLDVDNPFIVDTIKRQFAEFGVLESQLSFGSDYRITDTNFAVDNFLQNDVVAVANALKAGVSMIGLRGTHFPAQQTARLLEQLERDEWVSSDRLNYSLKILKMVKEQNSKPVSDKELKRSNLEDLSWFAKNFRTRLLSDQGE